MRKLVFDESKLTLADYEDFYEYAGRELEEALKRHVVRDETGRTVYETDEEGHETGRPVTELRMLPRDLTAFAWILARAQVDANLTPDDVRKWEPRSFTITEPDEGKDESAPNV